MQLGIFLIKKQTGIELNALSIKKLQPDELIPIQSLRTIDECKNYTTHDEIPLGRIAVKNVLRYFYQGSLLNNDKELNVFKKYIAGSLQTVKSLENYFSINNPDLIIMMNGVGNLDQSLIYHAEKLKIII